MSCTLRALGALALVCSTGCISPEAHRDVLSANEVLRDEVADLKRSNLEYQNELRRLEAEVKRMAPLVKDAAFLERQKQLVASILERMPKEGEISGVQTVDTPDGPALRVEGAVLFASGSATLSTGGQKTLDQLVRAVNAHTGPVRVDGHTDTDPISHSKWESNMHLSAARALAVRQHLVGAGVPAEKASVAGFGEFRPVDPQDKAKNRRVEIVLLR